MRGTTEFGTLAAKVGAARRGDPHSLSSHVARSSLLVVGLEPSRGPWRRRVPGTRTFRVLISNPGRRPMAPCPPPCFPASWWPSDATRGGTSERRAETRPKNGGGKRKGGGERGESESVRGGRGRERDEGLVARWKRRRWWWYAVHDINMYVSSAATCPTTRLGQTHASSQ